MLVARMQRRWRIELPVFVAILCCNLSHLPAAEPIHLSGVQLKLNTNSVGYDGSGTGTLVKRGGHYYLVTAFHNIQRANLTLEIDLEADVFFNKSDFAEVFVINEGADLAVARFLPGAVKESSKKRFQELMRSASGVANPIEGQGLVAVGNPVFKYDSDTAASIVKNIVYHATVADYSTPDRFAGANVHVWEEMMILDSLSIMPGFSGGPLLYVRNDDSSTVEIAGIVVGGDPRTVVSPGRFVFAVPATDIEAAIVELDSRLSNPNYAAKGKFQFLETSLNEIERPTRAGMRYASERIVVVDVNRYNFTNEVTDLFLAEIADRVKNADLIFYGGTFGKLDLSQLKPSRSTWIRCVFNDRDTLATANLMGARLIDCEFYPEGEEILPALGYGVTIIHGTTVRRPGVPEADELLPLYQEDSTFSGLEERLSSIDTLATGDDSVPAAAPQSTQSLPPRASLSGRQIQNLLTRDLFANE